MGRDILPFFNGDKMIKWKDLKDFFDMAIAIRNEYHKKFDGNVKYMHLVRLYVYSHNIPEWILNKIWEYYNDYINLEELTDILEKEMGK